MLTLILALAVGLLTAYASGAALGNMAWGGLLGATGFILVQIAAGLIIRRQVGKVNRRIQLAMQDVQSRLQRKVAQMQQRPGMSPKALQAALEKDQTAAVHQALEMTGELEKYRWWSPLLGKQINTMRMMFHYQVREFDKVDALADKSFYLEPTACAMRLARMYRKNDPRLDRFARKKLKSARGDAGALLYALYSWILVRRDNIPEAIKVLAASRKRCDHEALRANWERLVNNKVKNFSNAALGEMWYMLYLEEPKIKTQRVRQQY